MIRIFSLKILILSLKPRTSRRLQLPILDPRGKQNLNFPRNPCFYNFFFPGFPLFTSFTRPFLAKTAPTEIPAGNWNVWPYRCEPVRLNIPPEAHGNAEKKVKFRVPSSSLPAWQTWSSPDDIYSKTRGQFNCRLPAAWRDP